MQGIVHSAYKSSDQTLEVRVTPLQKKENPQPTMERNNSLPAAYTPKLHEMQKLKPKESKCIKLYSLKLQMSAQ